MIRQCRMCRAPKWATDPCASATCPSNTTTTIRRRNAVPTPGSRVATSRFGTGVNRVALFDGPKSLHGQTYVADVDGRHYYQ